MKKPLSEVSELVPLLTSNAEQLASKASEEDKQKLQDDIKEVTDQQLELQKGVEEKEKELEQALVIIEEYQVVYFIVYEIVVEKKKAVEYLQPPVANPAAIEEQVHELQVSGLVKSVKNFNDLLE